MKNVFSKREPETNTTQRNKEQKHSKAMKCNEILLIFSLLFLHPAHLMFEIISEIYFSPRLRFIIFVFYCFHDTTRSIVSLRMFV